MAGDGKTVAASGRVHDFASAGADGEPVSGAEYVPWLQMREQYPLDQATPCLSARELGFRRVQSVPVDTWRKYEIEAAFWKAKGVPFTTWVQGTKRPHSDE